MASKGQKKLTYEEELALLSPATVDPAGEDGHRRILAALASGRSLVVARAAKLVKEHRLDGFAEPLRAAFERYLPAAATASALQAATKLDPSCHAKLAAIEALDQTESVDPEPFARAVRHFQPEGSGDSAAPLRSAGIAGLARLGHRDFHMIVARLVSDRWPPVRQAALEALAHRDDGAGAPLALLKVELGDEDPQVDVAAMTALLTLAPDWALEVLSGLLDARGGHGGRRELAAVALGQSRRDDALALLLAKLPLSPRADEREALLRGIGLHRSDGALAAMLTIIREGKAAEATLAIEALASRRFEPGIGERVRRAAGENEAADDLAPVVAQVFDA